MLFQQSKECKKALKKDSIVGLPVYALACFVMDDRSIGVYQASGPKAHLYCEPVVMLQHWKRAIYSFEVTLPGL